MKNTGLEKFVDDNSIVLKIWSTTDVTLFIFAGASAEFALNKEVDWLFYTGKLPADPIGRLFSTIAYAQQIIFSGNGAALASIDKINSIHAGIEASRGRQISMAAYKDVLYMLIFYSISAYELLERKLTSAEKDEVVSSFKRIGERMHLNGIPDNYADWKQYYSMHLNSNLVYSHYTEKLFKQYRKNLGWFRYLILIEVQKLLVSDRVRELLGFRKSIIMKLPVSIYNIVRNFKIHKRVIISLVPEKFKQQVEELDQLNTDNRERAA